MVQAETRFVLLPDGRRIAYVEAGDPGGAPVLAFHGLPGSRFQQHPDAGIARTHGLRTIHPDRPGFGATTAHPARTLASWADDVAAMADRLGLGQFALAGVSGGGPFALACAAHLGARITRVALASSVGPPGSMRGARLATGAQFGFFLARRARWAMSAPLAAIAHLARTAPARYLERVAAQLAPADRAALARPDVHEMFVRDLAEAFRQGPAAMLHDLSLEARPWNLPLAAVRAAVALWHGEADWLVPPSASRALHAALPGSRLHVVPGAGHFMIFDAWPDIVRFLARG